MLKIHSSFRLLLLILNYPMSACWNRFIERLGYGMVNRIINKCGYLFQNSAKILLLYQISFVYIHRINFLHTFRTLSYVLPECQRPFNMDCVFIKNNTTTTTTIVFVHFYHLIVII